MMPRSLGMLLPCLRTQYLFFTIDDIPYPNLIPSLCLFYFINKYLERGTSANCKENLWFLFIISQFVSFSFWEEVAVWDGMGREREREMRARSKFRMSMWVVQKGMKEIRRRVMYMPGPRDGALWGGNADTGGQNWASGDSGDWAMHEEYGRTRYAWMVVWGLRWLGLWAPSTFSS